MNIMSSCVHVSLMVAHEVYKCAFASEVISSEPQGCSSMSVVKHNAPTKRQNHNIPQKKKIKHGLKARVNV